MYQYALVKGTLNAYPLSWKHLLIQQQQPHVRVHVREKETERGVKVKEQYLSQKHTCIDRTPYGRNDKSLFHFQSLHLRNPPQLPPCIPHDLSSSMPPVSLLLSIKDKSDH